ncbi:MAG: cytochrome c peroxidase [Pseudomonadota bacterium]
MKQAFLLALALPMTVSAMNFGGGNPIPEEKVALGKQLFHDKELSGNRNISCATCHHPLTDTGDGLSLPIGEGGVGLGVTRDTGSKQDAVHERVPRNAPPVFMLGSKELTHMFHDGRVALQDDFPSGVKTPAGHDLPDTLENIVAAQAMFPVTSPTEMAGQGSENSIARAAADGNLAGPGGVWELLAARLQAIPGYVDMFIEAFDDVKRAKDITYAHAANAIAAFEIEAWRANRSPYDAYLEGDNQALNRHEKDGLSLFFGKAGCAECHSGELFSDMDFHAIAMPQTGPGRGDGPDGHDDFGREQVTRDEEDLYRFRTPPLRNVALTAPYGHAGAYDTLEDVVLHHLDPEASLWAYHHEDYCREKPVLPSREDLDALDCVVMDDEDRVEDIAEANELDPVSLTDAEVDDLIAFLHALTDKSTIDLRRDVPKSLPSDLPLAE